MSLSFCFALTLFHLPNRTRLFAYVLLGFVLDALFILCCFNFLFF